MLRREQNDLLTQTGPGTPGGALFRRYWLPALLAEELPENECPPVRIKLLSERLLAWRDTQGRYALTDDEWTAIKPMLRTSAAQAEELFALSAWRPRSVRRRETRRDFAFTSLTRPLKDGGFGADNAHQVVPGIHEATLDRPTARPRSSTCGELMTMTIPAPELKSSARTMSAPASVTRLI